MFSRREYAPEWVDDDRLVVIPPSIDPFAVKNMHLPPEVVTATLARVGIVADGGRPGPVDFVRRDGGTGTVRPHRSSGGLLLGGDPPPVDVPLVVQVSRWDRLKDMAGVMEGFVRAVAGDDLAGAHLVLAGPEVSGVSDDPEGAEVLAECRDQWQRLPRPSEVACTWPPSRWTTQTRTPSSSTPCSGTLPWWCRRASSRASG